MNSGDILNDLADAFVALRRQESAVLAKIAEADRDGAAIPFGTVAKMVADVGRCGPTEARRLAERARVLHVRAGLSGTRIPAGMPHTASAYADGDIGSEHVDKIRGLAEELPAEVLAGEAWPIAEQALANHAREVGPRGLTRPIREFAARLDPDGQEPEERQLAEPRRELRLTRRRTRFDLAGFVDLETGLKLQALLDALGKPHSATANGGTPDMRTTVQRHGDAFGDAIALAATSRQLPECGGEPFTILLTATEQTLETGVGTATTMDGTRIPAVQAQRIACDSTLITSEGHRKRAPSTALRRALIARDRGCVHPDCDAPPAMVQAHHIQHYAHHGPTTLDNLVLLCAWHHRLVHHTNWIIEMRRGRPRLTPPHYRHRSTHSRVKRSNAEATEQRIGVRSHT